jgi:cytochrome c oxidase subunit 2
VRRIALDQRTKTCGELIRHSRQRRMIARGSAVALALWTIVALAGCGRQSTLSARSPQAHQIALLWWWMLAAATIVFLGAVALLGIAWWRRGKPGLPFFGQREDISQGLVLLFGIGVPIVVLSVLFGVANVYVVDRTSAPNPKTTSMTIDVIAHQWWWEVRYPGTQAVTANELHIPTGTRINLVGQSADVIHDFWVPQIARKVDLIPGKQNRILLYTTQPGSYRGQCAEFCGFQHANMGFFVIAQSPSAFQAWLANQAAPARTPSGGAATAGAREFMSDQCASCHEIRGTAAQATVGPDLTHLAGRSSLAGAMIPNNPHYLFDWISHPQSIKPGSRMPDLGLPQSDVQDIVAYLETLH